MISLRSSWRKSASRPQLRVFVGSFFAIMIGLANVAFGSQNVASAGRMGNSLLAKAPPDECFRGIGDPSNAYDPVPHFPDGVTCSAPAVPKVNQAYVWGLTKSGSKLWFGTVANTLCQVIGGLLGFTSPIQTASYVCEFGQSQTVLPPPFPFQNPLGAGLGPLGDFRPPQIFSYDVDSEALTPYTYLNLPAPATATDKSRLATTIGLRSAGSLGDVVFLAGPGFSGVNMFAFESSTGAFLGSQTFSQYGDIRTWVTYKGILYAGVQKRSGQTGTVLKWVGTEGSPFSGGSTTMGFDEVGNIDAEAANLAVHNGQLFATTWTGVLAVNPSPSAPKTALWVSPKIPHSGGLTTSDAANWTEIWQIDQYEPDPDVASTLVGGAIADYGGYVYWGTMQVPFSGALLLAEKYPQKFTNTANISRAILGTERPISIFRCCKTPYATAANAKVELLYGSAVLPVYDPAANRWKFQPNNMNKFPRFGQAGFGNPFNTYTWSMAVYHDKLFVGTFDWTYLLFDGLGPLSQALGISTLMNGPPTMGGLPNFLSNRGLGKLLGFGADLWRFDSPLLPASAEDRTGVGNILNYGIRNMLADEDTDTLYVGTANAMNLKTTPAQPEGGWELRSLWDGFSFPFGSGFGQYRP